ncbi:hypothetical protein BKA69DRAFT_1073481 [Paraphysoderma sedebokerense]|nr:hypothetical protein BKA69DRAFT_1073481 [Paraphysoderma sedebokerense]
MTVPAPIGALACQKDSYQKAISTTVIDCSSAPNKDGLYEVKLLDTVVFPEGGGQPADTGVINSNIKIHNVQRIGLDTIHFLSSPVEKGCVVTVEVDWERRYDAMQQHSGQHLLSAVAEKELGWNTVSWAFGPSTCSIEIAVTDGIPPLTQPHIDRLESIVNQHIRASRPIRVITPSGQDLPQQGETTTMREPSKELPNDLKTINDENNVVIRYIEIDQVDLNPCCGTHLRNTAEMQAIKLLHTESVRFSNIRLSFLVGNRVLSSLHSSFLRDRTLTSLLSCPPDDFYSRMDGVLKQTREDAKLMKVLWKEVANAVIEKIKFRLASIQLEAINIKNENQSDPCSLVIHHHRSSPSNLSFPQLLASSLQSDQSITKVVYVFTTGTVKSGGSVLVLGYSDQIKTVVKNLTDGVNDLKGGGGQGGGKKVVRWQGKAESWKGLDDVLKKLDAIVI